MTWTVDYNSTLHIIEGVFTGRTTESDLKESTTKAIALSKEQGKVNFLIDATELELTTSIFDLYDLPATQYGAENLNHQSRLALVLPKLLEEKVNVQFYKTTCVNRGWFVQLFPNRDKAIKWLKGTDPSNKPDAGDR